MANSAVPLHPPKRAREDVVNAKLPVRRAWGVSGQSAHPLGSSVVLVLPARAPHGLRDPKDPISFSQKAVFPARTKLAGDSGIV